MKFYGIKIPFISKGNHLRNFENEIAIYVVKDTQKSGYNSTQFELERVEDFDGNELKGKKYTNKYDGYSKNFQINSKKEKEWVFDIEKLEKDKKDVYGIICFRDKDLAKLCKINAMKHYEKIILKQLDKINEKLKGYRDFEKEIPHKII